MPTSTSMSSYMPLLGMVGRRTRLRNTVCTFSAVFIVLFMLLSGVIGKGIDSFADHPIWKSTSRYFNRGYRPQHGIADPPLETFLVGAGRENLPKIHLFTPITRQYWEKNSRQCHVLQGAIVNGYIPTIFNWNLTDGDNMPWQKPISLARILSSKAHTRDIADSDLIFLLDATDTWLQLSPQVAARRFSEYGVDVLAAAEKNCWPQPATSPDCVNAPEPPIDLRIFNSSEIPAHNRVPRHANSGTVIGRFDKMKSFFNELVHFMESHKDEFEDDQGPFNQWLTQGKIDLDYYSRMFWAGHDDQDSIEFLATRYPTDPSMYPHTESELEHGIPWNLYPHLAHHRLTGQVPVVAHFNGFSKGNLEPWWGKLWWQSNRFSHIIHQRLERGIVRFVTDDGYREETFKTVCARYMDEITAPTR